MKKILSFVLVIVMILSFAGCFSNDEFSSASDSEISLSTVLDDSYYDFSLTEVDLNNLEGYIGTEINDMLEAVNDVNFYVDRAKNMIEALIIFGGTGTALGLSCQNTYEEMKQILNNQNAEVCEDNSTEYGQILYGKTSDSKYLYTATVADDYTEIAVYENSKDLSVYLGSKISLINSIFNNDIIESDREYIGDGSYIGFSEYLVCYSTIDDAVQIKDMDNTVWGITLSCESEYNIYGIEVGTNYDDAIELLRNSNFEIGEEIGIDYGVIIEFEIDSENNISKIYVECAPHDLNIDEDAFYEMILEQEANDGF